MHTEFDLPIVVSVLLNQQSKRFFRTTIDEYCDVIVLKSGRHGTVFDSNYFDPEFNRGLIEFALYESKVWVQRV